VVRFKAGLFYDDDLRRQANQQQRNYWPVYYQEILSRIGLSYSLLGPENLTEEALAQYTVLLLPPLEEGYLKPEQQAAIARWVEGGGLLVGFATKGLEELFGIAVEGSLPQIDDEFSPSSSIRLVAEDWTHPLLPRDLGDASLPILAPMQLVTASQGRQVARLYSIVGKDQRRPAITYRNVGRGAAVYWAFDLAQCVWVMHQGRPVVEDYDGDGVYRVRDGIATCPWRGEVPYADIMLFLLRDLIAAAGGVFLHQLPPAPDGSIPDAVFYWGGDANRWDDEHLQAVEFMRGLGLPYHVNIQQVPPGNRLLSVESFRRLKELGCEVGIQFCFEAPRRDDPQAFTKEEIEYQLRVHQEAYGETPVVGLLGRSEWTGWAEPARWLAELGLKGENTRAGRPGPRRNPLNSTGFAFGTAYPFHYYDDWSRGNERIELTCLPIVDYECGFRYPEDVLDLENLHRVIDLAAFWNLPVNMFRHPTYIVKTKSDPQAIKQALEYMRARGIRALHMGVDEMCLWWHARAASGIEDVTVDQGVTTIRTRTDYPGGCIVQLHAPGDAALTVRVNGRPAVHTTRQQHGARWLYVAVPSGEATVRIS